MYVCPFSSWYIPAIFHLPALKPLSLVIVHMVSITLKLEGGECKTFYTPAMRTFHASIVLKDLLCRPLQLVCSFELPQVIN